MFSTQSSLRGFDKTLKEFQRNGEFRFELENNGGGETFYVIHPVLKHIAILGN